MKVTIDTTIDNKESIRHAIKLLQAHIGDEPTSIVENTSSSSEESSPAPSADMFSMFGDSPSQTTSEVTSTTENSTMDFEENTEASLETSTDNDETQSAEDSSEESDHKIEIIDL